MKSQVIADPNQDRSQFISENLHCIPVHSLPEITLYTAHADSGLWRLAAPGDIDPAPPYWAYQWPGGMALAHYFCQHPETVSGQRVLDLGAGSGLVAIAAAKAGASDVFATDIDPFAIAAMALNAAANGVAVTAIEGDLLVSPPPNVDLVTVGDLFYAPDLAERVIPFLDACLDSAIKVLIGDIGRAWLPHLRLTQLTSYRVLEFGEGGTPSRPGNVYAFARASP